MVALRTFAPWRIAAAAARGLAGLSLFIAASLIISMNIPGPAHAGSKPLVNTLGSPGIAIKGYDPVAYFEKGGPRKGKAQFSLQHGNVRWRFESAENMAKFKADPAKYTPAYGGYCAYGVAQGYLVKIEPDAWSIREGKLYLNYSKRVQRLWEKRPDSYISKANAKWPRLTNR